VVSCAGPGRGSRRGEWILSKTIVNDTRRVETGADVLMLLSLTTKVALTVMAPGMLVGTH
jgi:hypothetical protein